MKYFTKKMTLDEVKAAYRAAAMKLHPDRGGSTEAMQQLNKEFEVAFAIAQKFAKADPMYTKQQPKTAESAGSYRQQFYTVNGWQGKRYDPNLSKKEIAKIIREYVKYVHPTYRFSITTEYFSGGSEISIALTETPIELTTVDIIRKYLHSVHWTFYYYPQKAEQEYRDMNEQDIEEYCAYICEETKKYHQSAINCKWLHPAVANVIEDVYRFAQSYNYDDSDSMVDHFDVNFYFSFTIGKWNKPAKFVERTARISPTKKAKSVKRLTA